MTVNKSGGNMYENVQTWNPLGGECSHKCKYCYVKANRWPQTKEKYSGTPRIYDNQFKSLGKGKTVFVCNMTDLFAADVPNEYIRKIIDHANNYGNTYIWQTKNPGRLMSFSAGFPGNSIFIITLESDMDHGYSRAPTIEERYKEILELRPFLTGSIGITIEPIQRFNLGNFLYMLVNINPDFIYIGADSKGHGLIEPTTRDIEKLIYGLKKMDIEVRIKDNLKRLSNIKDNSQGGKE